MWSVIALVAAISTGTLFLLIARLDARIDALSATMDTRFGRVDERFDRLDDRFTHLDRRLDAHLGRHAG